MAFAIKAEVRDPRAKTFVFAAQKTMYGGKRIAKGVVTRAEAVAKRRDLAKHRA